ncbi:hypothetical protein L249_7574 [Ophiocordyceps polyrhachis-furcata BCC 54312]|uniref:Uncharacterized protein n=1 Tax=Ophiocordyceps polyrhachis-furcata BCC 54312 TaxID=1330021 RepID=A0A367LBA5_9HYPO|nr:hypothetical protein L249_7574 [Ophiocordyceps polyrhachis-furcata BCC 54312]
MKILAAEDTDNVDVPGAVPVLRHEGDAVVEMWRKSHSSIVVLGALDERRQLERRILQQHDAVGVLGAASLAVTPEKVHKVSIRKLGVIDRDVGIGVLGKVILLEDGVGVEIPNAMLGPDAFSETPVGVTIPAVAGVIVPGDLAARVDQGGSRLVGAHAAHVPGFDLAGSAHAGQHGLPKAWTGAFLQVEVLGDDGQVEMADHAPVGFVEALPADDDEVLEMAGLSDSFGQMGAGVDKVVLYVDAVDDAPGREVAAGEEESEDGSGGEAVVVGGPNHPGKLVGVRPGILYKGGLGGSKGTGIEAAGVDGPQGSARAASEARPDILMRVHKDVEAVGFGDAQDVDCVLDEVLVVLAGASSLDSLPGEDVADRVEAVASDASEVSWRVLPRERPLVK